MPNYAEYFKLDPKITYLNNAYLAPQLKTALSAGAEAMLQMENPVNLGKEAYFEPAKAIRSSFANIIGAEDPSRVSLIPSASYGLANAAHNIRPTKGSNVVLLQGQFPSNVYIWQRLCRDFGCELRWVDPPTPGPQFGTEWNQVLLESIDAKTALVAIPPVFWSDGVSFDLMAVRQRTKEVGAYLIVDGSQAVGAWPIDVKTLQPDALVCAAYKWLMGPYGTGLAWYGPNFDQGEPIEDNWLAHEGASDFQNLVNYNPKWAPVGQRFSAGQHPAFLQLAMLGPALKQVAEWGPELIQEHARELLTPFEHSFREIGCELLSSDQRSAHLFGLGLPAGCDLQQVKQLLDEAEVYVSLRGNSLRISTYLYNEANDLAKLLACLKGAL